MDQTAPRDDMPGISPVEAQQLASSRASHRLAGLDRHNSLGYALMTVAKEPMAILDRDLRVVAASRSYYRLFPAKFAAERGRPFCEPDELRWNASALHTLRNVVSSNGAIVDECEIHLDVPNLGERRMMLSARRMADTDIPEAVILLGLEDVTERLEAECLRDELAKQQEVLSREAHHRIANSLQIIASLLLLKAGAAQSDETRTHLRDVHKRLILVAMVQRQLCSAGMREEIEFGPYAAQLCYGLANSMTEGDGAVTILTSSSAGKIKSDEAVSFGLIIAELVINALKHGFPGGRRGSISVEFDAQGADWRLSVSDDGIGPSPDDGERGAVGLGTNIVEALSRQLRAKVVSVATESGFSTSIIHREQTG